jgi:hypothetical protein
VTLFRRPLAAVLGLALPLLVAAPGGALAAKTSHHVVRHRVVRHRVTHHSVAKTKG